MTPLGGQNVYRKCFKPNSPITTKRTEGPRGSDWGGVSLYFVFYNHVIHSGF